MSNKYYQVFHPFSQGCPRKLWNGAVPVTSAFHYYLSCCYLELTLPEIVEGVCCSSLETDSNKTEFTR